MRTFARRGIRRPFLSILSAKFTRRIGLPVCAFFILGVALLSTGQPAASAADGDLDATFGNGGVVAIDNAANLSDQARAVAVQADGKIVVGGEIAAAPPDGFAILNRLNPDGSLDTSFGSGGKIIGPQMTLGGLAILPDGKILTVGSMRSSTIPMQYFILTRYNPNGTLDTTFGTNGYAYIAPQTEPVVFTVGNALVIQPDGRIVAAGVGSIYPQGDKFLIARFNADGSRDQSFGSEGVVFTRFGGGEAQALAVALQPDGKIVASGSIEAGQMTRNFALARYSTDGSIDADFGLEGMVTTNFVFENYAKAHSVVIQPDGKIIAVGGYTRQSHGFLLARYNSDGRLDQGYGTGGKVMSSLGGGNGSGFGNAARLQRDGKLLVAGSLSFVTTGTDLISLARYAPNGAFDQTFGKSGVVNSDLNMGLEELNAIAVQPDGKLVAAGYTSDPSYSYTNFAVVRYGFTPEIPNRTPFDFDGDSRADISVYRGGDWFLLQSSSGFAARPFGLATDHIVPADYDGDGKTDIAVFRPTEGNWYCLYSGNGTWSGIHFGTDGDVPAVGDYDADGRADYAVFRAGTWYVQRSTAGFFAQQFGLSTDRPVAADFDGDGKTDIAVYRDGTWYIDGSTRGFTAQSFGLAGDRTVAADYDGDGKADIAVWRPEDGNWYIFRSSDGAVTGAHWGMQGDMSAPADYDGDGRADYAVFRGNGDWWISQSGSGASIYEKFGLTGDIPVPNSQVR